MVLAILLGCGARASWAGEEIRGAVGYVAGKTIYIDIGRSAGISAGDTLSVTRAGEIIGSVVVIHTASTASSCTSLSPVEIRVGDEVTAGERALGMEMNAGRGSAVAPAEAPARRMTRIDGSVSLGSVLSEDLTDSGLGFSRPSLSTRLRVRDIAGRPLTLELRQRSRYYGRESRLRSGGPEDRWTHQIYQLSLTYRPEGSPYTVRWGRILPSVPRGVGYVDGILFGYRSQRHFELGVVGGFRPDEYSADLRFDERTVGAFAAIDLEPRGSDDLELSGAFVGSYRSGTVDREVFVSEGNYSAGTSFSASGSVEIDLNRGWKREMGEAPLDLTRLFLGARYRAAEGLSLHLSYDGRRPARTADNRATPDSLFDDTVRRGLRAGVSWSASPRIRLAGSAGVRFRSGRDNTMSADGSARIRGFPARGVNTGVRFALFRTMFNNGYRPMAEIGVKPLRDLMLDVGAGDTIYDTAGEKSHDPWVTSSLRYRLTRRQFLALRFAAHMSARLRSARLSGETGIRF